MGLKLLVDLEKLRKVKNFKCEYPYHPKERKKGVLKLMELSLFGIYCRRCPEAFCVSSCPVEALKKLDDGRVVRSNFKCIGCKTCSLACPFGTIWTDFLNYINFPCDMCAQKLSVNPDYVPVCVKSTNGAVTVEKDIKEDPENGIFAVSENLFVKAVSWRWREKSA